MEIESKTLNFLKKGVESLPKDNDDYRLLESYYLLQCRQNNALKSNVLEKKLGIPQKRCAKCCLSWSDGSDTTKKLDARKVSKNVRKKIIKKKKRINDKAALEYFVAEMTGNVMEKECRFCKNKTMVVEEEFKTKFTLEEKPNALIKEKYSNNTKKTKNKGNPKIDNNLLFAPTKAVFNAKKEIKEQSPLKSVKRNKKKDKFAGLCKTAVLTAKSNKVDPLSIFLKKSK